MRCASVARARTAAVLGAPSANRQLFVCCSARSVNVLLPRHDGHCEGDDYGGGDDDGGDDYGGGG